MPEGRFPIPSVVLRGVFPEETCGSSVHPGCFLGVGWLAQRRKALERVISPTSSRRTLHAGVESPLIVCKGRLTQAGGGSF
jgi:hypothetical protein